jgi:hypothetical protein
MCMTEQSELAYKAMDETAEWGAANRVVFLRRVHELEPHVMPEAPQSMTLREAVICVVCSLGVFALILAVAASHS